MQIPSSRPSLHALAAAGLALALGCGEPTGPRENVLAPDVVVTGRVEAVDRPVEYKLPVKAGDEFVVYFQSSKVGLTLTVLDPGDNTVLGQAQDGSPDGELTDVRTPAIRVEKDADLLVRVSARPEADFGEFRLRVTPVPRQPEGRPAHVALNDTVTESLQSDIDVDEFTFDAAANDEVIAFLKLGDAASRTMIEVQLTGPDGKPLLEWPNDLRTDDPTMEFERVSSGRIVLAASGRYRARVQRWGSFGHSASVPYTFQVRRVDRQPERVAAALTPNDTVDAERLDHVGDIDEFVIAGNPGDAYNVFVQSLGPASNVVHAQVVDQASTLIEVKLPEALTAGGIGTVILPTGGRLTVRVSGAYDQYGLYRGPYRILAYRINPAPERATATLAWAVPVKDDIELPGDVDRFSFTLASAAIVNVGLVRSQMGAAVQARLRRAGEQTDLASAIVPYSPVDGRNSVATGNVQLAAGTYVVDVDAYQNRKGGFTGEYQLTVYQINTAPEHHAATVAIGDTITGEAVDHVGDVDVFTFAGTAGQSVRTFLRDSSRVFAGVGIEIVHPRLGPVIQRPSHYSWPPPTMRVELPETGTYELHVRQSDSKEHGTAVAYAAGVLVASRAPESTPAAITLGARVTEERTDYRGDIDEFTLTGTSGQEMMATFVARTEQSVFMTLTAVDPASGSALAAVDPYVKRSNHTGRFRIPASGRVVFRVVEGNPRCVSANICYHETGPFELQTRRIDRAPDSASARIVVGGSVQNEAVDFPGDIDEFLLAGTAGQRIRLRFRAFYGTNRITYGDSLAVELIDPATSAVLTSMTTTVPEGYAGDKLSDVVTLPGSRDFLIRVRGVRDHWDGVPFYLGVESPP